MTVNLSKGSNISLTKNAPGLTHAVVGLGWNPRTTDGAKWDLDASAIVCKKNADGKLMAISDAHFVFYNNLKDPSGMVAHQGDNRTGDGDGDDEMIFLDLEGMPADVDAIVFIVSIDSPANATFGQVQGAYIRVLDANDPDNSEKEVRFDLNEDAAGQRSLNFGEVYRHNGDWKFRAVGEGYNNGLAGVIADYGLMAE